MRKRYDEEVKKEYVLKFEWKSNLLLLLYIFFKYRNDKAIRMKMIQNRSRQKAVHSRRSKTSKSSEFEDNENSERF